MSATGITRYLGEPAQFRRQLLYRLPRLPAVEVTPRAADESRCPAWRADHYEIHAYYTATAGADAEAAYAALEAALRAIPGVYATTLAEPKVAWPQKVVEFSNPDWPARLGTARRDRNALRMQVMALIRPEAWGEK